MRACPECGGNMVLWGHGRMERWRCPACFRKRRKGYHAKVEIDEGAPGADRKYDQSCLDVLWRMPHGSFNPDAIKALERELRAS